MNASMWAKHFLAVAAFLHLQKNKFSLNYFTCFPFTAPHQAASHQTLHDNLVADACHIDAIQRKRLKFGEINTLLSGLGEPQICISILLARAM